LCKFLVYRNLLNFYLVKDYPIEQINKLSSKLLELYKEIYEQDLEEYFNLKISSIF
jgi:hypothetical protein